MDRYEQIEAFWSGDRPDQIPLTIYGFFVERQLDPGKAGFEDPQWRPLFERGLIPTYGIRAWEALTPDVEEIVEEYEENGEPVTRRTLRTPVGDVSATWGRRWHMKYWLETAEDCRVLTWIERNTTIEPHLERAAQEFEALEPFGVGSLWTHRTPLQRILVDDAGPENFGLALYEFEDEFMELYEAKLANFSRIIDIVAECPGRMAWSLENFSLDMVGRDRFERLILPVYQREFPKLHAAGKKVMVHYDGRLRAIADLVAEAPFDVIDSLTEPPEGDMTVAEARSAWPDKGFWHNLGVGDYQLPADALRKRVLQRVEDGSVDGRLFAIEISEDLPENWRESIPVVLDALEETRSG